MHETQITILVRTAVVPGPQGPQAGIQVMLKVEGHQSDNAAFVLMALDQVKALTYQQIVAAAAPRLMVPGAVAPPDAA